MKSRGILGNVISWVLAAAFLFVGSAVASRGLDLTPHPDDLTVGEEVLRARALEIVEREEWSQEMGPGFYITGTSIMFNARVTGGERDGQVLLTEHHIDDLWAAREREVVVGDRILIAYNHGLGHYTFVDYIRINYVVILGVVLLVLIVLLGRLKGLNSIIALGFTCLAVFVVLVPGILAGRSIHLTAILVSVYIIIFSLVIVIGPSRKALSAILGCLGGVFVAALLMLFMDIVLNLTGAIDQDSQFLLTLPLAQPLSLGAIVFAGVVIGAVGAIMDVATSIASSLWEVKLAGGGEGGGFAQIFKSGLNIGKDILGTMLNTLILAYIGSSLSLILLITFYSYDTSLLELFNREMISVEILRALVGSFGIFSAVPLTSAICGWLYSGKWDKPSRNRRESYESNW
ncbi:MAG: YibE/F family protein [Oscillospiraceae bacterium]|nr:YibE/F family protein [Oscillospiraceae bacterium]